MDNVYVFGHKNPDTDTISSAIGYAHLKNLQTPGHVPARLGELNRETEFVLRTFGISSPIYLPHVYIRAQDIMRTHIIAAPAEATVFEVGELMRRYETRGIPIVDKENCPKGVVTERSLARGYLNELHVQGLRNNPTAVSKIASTLNGRIIIGDPDSLVRGNAAIGAMHHETMTDYIQPGDLLILGDRENAQEAALNSGISCLIITGNFEPSGHIKTLARQVSAAIIVTPYDTFGAARLINLSVPAQTILQTDVLMVTPDSIVNEFTPDLLASRHEMALVTDTQGKLVGLISKGDIVAHRRHRVILMDHSERSQSADGIDRADIIEIIDHHRLGGLETAGPIYALIAPVGSTSTLVFRRYRELGEEPPREVAGLLVGAILSDTMLLKSPTTTPEDAEAVERLGRILGEDPLEFGREMYNAKFDVARMSPTDIVGNDLKEFTFGSATVAIAQVEVANAEPVLARKGEIVEAMQKRQESKEYDLTLLMVTDILREGTELLAVGRTRAVERAFGVSLDDSSVYLPGVMSRKKQVVPPLMGAF